MKPLNRRNFVTALASGAGVALAVPVVRAGDIFEQAQSSSGGPPPNLPFVSLQATDTIQLNDNGSYSVPSNIPTADQPNLAVAIGTTPVNQTDIWPSSGMVLTALDLQAVQNWMATHAPSGFVLGAPAPQPNLAGVVVVIVIVVILIVAGVICYGLWKMSKLIK